MVRLHRQNAGGGTEINLVRDERCGPLVRSDADILEDKCPEEEIQFVGVGIEGLALRDEPGSHCSCGEAGSNEIAGRDTAALPSAL